MDVQHFSQGHMSDFVSPAGDPVWEAVEPLGTRGQAGGQGGCDPHPLLLTL